MGFDFRIFFRKLKYLQKLKVCDMLHQDFYVNNFVLPQCLTVFYSTVMW